MPFGLVKWPFRVWLPLFIQSRMPYPIRAASAAFLSVAMATTAFGGTVAATDDGTSSSIATPADAGCVRTADPAKSVARLWDEALLDAIRRDFPAPTVHARNLYHVSAAMWDGWAAYDPDAVGVFFTEKRAADDIAAAREETISYAAHRLLSKRYERSDGGRESLRQFDDLMDALCYSTDTRVRAKDEGPAALGVRIANKIIRKGEKDGSREKRGYRSRNYRPVNDPMVVALPGTSMEDPNRWQPLALEVARTQNGQLLPLGPQEFIGPHWGEVTSFALPEPVTPGLPIDPGAPPFLGDPISDGTFKADAVDVIRYSAMLDPRDGVVVDISPATMGNGSLGANDGSGHGFNPYTGLPYEPNVVPRADFGRVIAEFWADGPDSETPPGHWNSLANDVTDALGPERLRIGGVGELVDPLEWDVKLYLALNGALHDAAIAAWGAKAHYDYVRPISMIRHMGGLGQSTDPELPSYHPDGLPLEPGLVELVTEASTAPGERHAHLAEHVGEIAIRAWAGNPEDETELAGVEWIRAVEWVPYQLASFVTPSFAGYVSGHSAFSRAAAALLTEFTGSPYFPGGMSSWTVPAGSLHFEAGPSEDVELQWATYADAADQAGISRLYGGIHVAADDLDGRVIGAQCGIDAWELAQRYWSGTVG
jgi:hypothetical protein